MQYILQTYNVTKTLQSQEIISNVNMKVKKGEIYGFLGPNGAGKTTIMKMITQLTKPTAGEIVLFDEKITNHSHEVLKRMGSIIEYPIFYENLSATKNLELHCAYMGYHDKNSITEALSLVNLKTTNDKPVKEFSLGMKQRLGIARAITTKPEFLILDEPINGLDPIGIKEMRDLFKMLSSQYGITILISSHILAEIEQIADTIGVINHGKLIQEVPMSDIRNRNTEYIEIVTSDYKKASYVLTEILSLSNFKILDDGKIRIYDTKKDQNEISKTLILNDVMVHSFNKTSSSLEEYFLDLLNRGDKNV